MPYVCLIEFEDLSTGKIYKAGEAFDPTGSNDKRLAELLSPFNAIEQPVIRYVDEEKPKRNRKKEVEADEQEVSK